MEAAIRSEISVRFESFELNLRTGELYRNGLRVRLRGRPVDVLAILLERPGELVTRETFKKRLWPDNTFVDFEQILNNSVAKLRDALGDKAESPKFIETLPRLGYRFIAPIDMSKTVNQTSEAPDQAAQDPPVAAANPVLLEVTHSGVHRITKRWFLWPVVALAVALVAFGCWYMRTPLPAPRVTHYEQLTLDGREKFPVGTDGTRIYMNLSGRGRSIAQISVSGGKITEIPIEVPLAGGFLSGLQDVSPDGSSFLVMNQLVGNEGFKVWVVGALGRPARYLTRAYTAAWSPDGESVVYINAHGDIYTIPVEGGEPRLLHREDAPAGQIAPTAYIRWSPDGTTIRYSRWPGRIFEVSSTGTNFHEWFPGWNGSVLKCCGRWTPDGEFFVFLAGRTLAKAPTFRPPAQIWAADERHGRMRPRIPEPTLLASGPLLWGEPVPSRDGKMIFARGVSLRGELERYDSASKRLKPYLGGISAEMPDYSRDGKYVAYVSFPDGILWRANRDGSGLVQLTEPPFYPTNPHWSPDGKQILFTDSAKNGAAAIHASYVVSSQGGTPKRLLPDVSEPQNLADWSPDGTNVVYTTAWRSPGSGIFNKIETRIVELDTGKVTTLPERSEGFWAPLWSPDGRYIAGQSLDKTEIATFDLKTQKWKTLVQKQDLAFHNWSHDGRFIYFLCGNQVFRVPVQGGTAELFFDLPDGFRGTGFSGFFMGLDPTDAPLFLSNAGTDEIYALTLGQG